MQIRGDEKMFDLCLKLANGKCWASASEQFLDSQHS